MHYQIQEVAIKEYLHGTGKYIDGQCIVRIPYIFYTISHKNCNT